MLDILMATYNGESFLRQQLDSIFNQDSAEWRLLIRDDGSEDSTPAILDEYKSKYSDRIEIFQNSGEPLGAAGNFACLLEKSKADYAMFADQDDVWMPDKVSITMAKMHELESGKSEKMPILIHADLKVVDENLNTIYESFISSHNHDPLSKSLPRLVMQNFVTGSTIMANRPLLDLAKPIPNEAVMHDWWLMLTASVFGDIGFVDKPLVMYRQHKHNVLGAKRVESKCMCGFFRRFPEKLIKALKYRENLRLFTMQARVFLERFGAKLNKKDFDTFANFAKLMELSWFGRRKSIINNDFWKNSFKNNVYLLIFS